MLVFNRQLNETIRIGEDVSLTIIEIRGDKVRIGIEAPRHVPVHRGEIFERLKMLGEDINTIGKGFGDDV